MTERAAETYPLERINRQRRTVKWALFIVVLLNWKLLLRTDLGIVLDPFGKMSADEVESELHQRAPWRTAVECETASRPWDYTCTFVPRQQPSIRMTIDVRVGRQRIVVASEPRQVTAAAGPAGKS
jgi:hypothetical protein